MKIYIVCHMASDYVDFIDKVFLTKESANNYCSRKNREFEEELNTMKIIDPKVKERNLRTWKYESIEYNAEA